MQSIEQISCGIYLAVKPWLRLLRCFKTRTTAGESSGAPGNKNHKTIYPAGYSQGTQLKIKYLAAYV